MTVQEAINRLTQRPDLDKEVLNSPFFKFWHRFDTETCDQIAAIIEQQQSTIEKLKCCGNCKKWNNEWTYTGIDNYCDDRNTINPASTDKCDKWEGIA